MWLKMSEIAKELGVSKDVVKYHRKNGEIYISPEGIEWIKKKLKKDTYHANFEEYTRAKLKESTGKLDLIYDLLLDQLIVIPEVSGTHHQDQNINLVQLIENEAKSHDFIQWYCNIQTIEEWADWRYKFVTLTDFITYLNQKQTTND